MSTLLLPFLVACGTVGLDPLGSDTGAVADSAPVYEGPIYVESISPAWGPTSGGTAVTLSGWGFGEAPLVSWGNLEIEVTALDDETIAVTTPSSSVETTVDVTVSSDAGSYTAYDAFVYSDSGPPEDLDTGDEGGGDGEGGGDSGGGATGLLGGVVEISRLQIACPACFGTTDDFELIAAASFVEPTTGSWLSWLPSPGDCVVDPVRTAPSSTPIDVGDWAYLSTGSTSIALARSQQSASELYYMAMEMTLSDYISNAAYDLSAPDGGTLGAVNESDVLITPQGFDSITPLELLYTSPQSAFSAQIRRSGTTFTWSPSGGSGYFLIQLDVYNAQGSALVSQIYCLGYDNGTLTVPGSYLSSMPSGGLVAVHLNRYSLDEIVLSNNGSTLETAAASGVLGTGIISN